MVDRIAEKRGQEEIIPSLGKGRSGAVEDDLTDRLRSTPRDALERVLARVGPTPAPPTPDPKHAQRRPRCINRNQIFKLLPKTNCKECGCTNLPGLRMNLASGKAELDSCPYVSPKPGAACPSFAPPSARRHRQRSAPLYRRETVQYRHEKPSSTRRSAAAVVRHLRGGAGHPAEALERVPVTSGWGLPCAGAGGGEGR